ncbi:hypothetical protein CHK_2185 [Christensenella hongkongensis]|uniref:Uncharacterized protein n=1 Tax=Christensenella hongkongensis TaxID=270498 RepID=A0A0M2NI69_9FIRM|nr:hypothetical protein CHK_2185 [Christensenella hongkongensis]
MLSRTPTVSGGAKTIHTPNQQNTGIYAGILFRVFYVSCVILLWIDLERGFLCYRNK